MAFWRKANSSVLAAGSGAAAAAAAHPGRVFLFLWMVTMAGYATGILGPLDWTDLGAAARR